MIYRSNLSAPDLSPHFRMLCAPMPHSFGHSIPSDQDFDPKCGFMSHDEAAILYHCATRARGNWLDIGARVGWTTAHIAEAGCEVMAVDRDMDRLYGRFSQNADKWLDSIHTYGGTAAQYFADWGTPQRHRFDGFCIDGDHDSPQPLLDAQGCEKLAKATAVMVFHDFYGKPIRDGVRFLMEEGFKCRVHWTPNGMAVCWRGDFVPPDHVPDPAIDWRGIHSQMVDFDFGACS